MKTRSVSSSSEYWLSVNLNGGWGRSPSSSNTTRRGPRTPRCSQTDDEPGPPLNENVSGRFEVLMFFQQLCAIAILGIGDKEDLRPRLLPLRFLLTIGVSSLRTIVPAVTVYLISLPPIRTLCCVTTRLSFGVGFSSFFFFFGFLFIFIWH